MVDLQNDLHSLFTWSEKWQLKFNTAKCKVLHIGKTNPTYTYYVDSHRLNRLSTTDTEKDLGVVFDQGLNFDLHIHNCINRANRLTGIIYRSFTY